MRVLMVKTSSMGDVIHALPALTDAMRAIPGIRFDWVVEEGFAEIPRWHPAVDEVIPVAIRRWRKNLWQTLRDGEWQTYVETLQSREYDLVIDAQGLIKSAVLATRLAYGPKCGMDRRSAREGLAAMFYDRSFPVAKDLHAVERVRQLFAAAFGYPVPEQLGEAMIRDQFPASDGDYLMFLHGTTRFDKHWPEAYWAQLLAIATGAGWRVRLPWGSQAERERAQRLAALYPDQVEVLPKLRLSEVAQQLAGAAGVVSVDTGLAHLAAALECPNVILYGPTDPKLVGGYGAGQLCLEAKDQPTLDSKAATAVQPEVFAPLTPEIVWTALSKKLAVEQAKRKMHNAVKKVASPSARTQGADATF